MLVAFAHDQLHGGQVAAEVGDLLGREVNHAGRFLILAARRCSDAYRMGIIQDDLRGRRLSLRPVSKLLLRMIRHEQVAL